MAKYKCIKKTFHNGRIYSPEPGGNNFMISTEKKEAGNPCFVLVEPDKKPEKSAKPSAKKAE